MGKITELKTVIQNEREKRWPWSLRMLNKTSRALFRIADLGSDANSDNPATVMMRHLELTTEEACNSS